jgi:hypothetical protein
MSPIPRIMLVGSFALAACGRADAPKPPSLAEVLPNVPLPPQPTFVSRSGGADALQLTVRSPVAAEVVTSYYRQLFKRTGWRLVNEAKDRDSAVVFFVEQDGPPLWVRIRKADDGHGSLVEIAGARVSEKRDTTTAPAPPAPKPTS